MTTTKPKSTSVVDTDPIDETAPTENIAEETQAVPSADDEAAVDEPIMMAVVSEPLNEPLEEDQPALGQEIDDNTGSNQEIVQPDAMPAVADLRPCRNTSL